MLKPLARDADEANNDPRYLTLGQYHTHFDQGVQVLLKTKVYDSAEQKREMLGEVICALLCTAATLASAMIASHGSAHEVVPLANRLIDVINSDMPSA